MWCLDAFSGISAFSLRAPLALPESHLSLLENQGMVELFSIFCLWSGMPLVGRWNQWQQMHFQQSPYDNNSNRHWSVNGLTLKASSLHSLA